jgi:hypothetical protein
MLQLLDMLSMHGILAQSPGNWWFPRSLWSAVRPDQDLCSTMNGTCDCRLGWKDHDPTWIGSLAVGPGPAVWAFLVDGVQGRGSPALPGAAATATYAAVVQVPPVPAATHWP